MFTSVNRRSAAAYQSVKVETAVSEANPHQLVDLLFDGLLESLSLAKAAVEHGDITAKGKQVSRAVRIIDEGLKPGLNLAQGGDIAANLHGLYGYCVLRLTEGNLRGDRTAFDDVAKVIDPLAQAWKQIGKVQSAAAHQS